MEALGTIAEIAITLIGFVGIFVAFRFSEIKIGKSDFIDFLISAVGAVLFAFLPLLLLGVLEESLMWRVSCGVFGMFHLTIYIISAWVHFREKAVAPIEYLFAAFSLPIIGLKLAVGLGELIDYAYHIYLLGLVWLVFNCLFIFFNIMMATLWDSDESA